SLGHSDSPCRFWYARKCIRPHRRPTLEELRAEFLVDSQQRWRSRVQEVSMKRSARFVMLALLYVAQALPLGFFVIAMPAILRARGVGLERVGLLAALALPFLLKFLWAPLVDRWGSANGHYRSWLIPLQLA